MSRPSSIRWHKPAVALLASLLMAVIAIVLLNREALHAATGSVSHSLCAAAFVSRVDPDRVSAEEQLPLMGGIGWAVRYHRRPPPPRSAQLRLRRLLRPGRSTATGLGCLLDPRRRRRTRSRTASSRAPVSTDVPRPARRSHPPIPALRRALDHAFAEPDPAHPRLTKAVVVLHDGQLIAERYAPATGRTPRSRATR